MNVLNYKQIFDVDLFFKNLIISTIYILYKVQVCTYKIYSTLHSLHSTAIQAYIYNKT